MTDTGEMGFGHDDPATRGGIGVGAVPDDLTDGEAQEAELEQERETWGEGPAEE